MAGLSISDVVNVQVTLTPLAVPSRNFGSLLILGPSSVIDVNERERIYSSSTQVLQDFGSTAPEYLAAIVFFAQNPQPAQLTIGRWAQTATPGILYGGVIPVSTQAARIAAFQAITSGGFTMTIGGSLRTVAALNFSSDTTMTQIATRLNTAMSAYATCVWDTVNNRFVITSTGTGGTAGAITYMSATATSAAINGTLATGGTLVQGINAETAAQSVAAHMLFSNAWYGVMFAPFTDGDVNLTQVQLIAPMIEAANPVRIFGFNTSDPACYDPTSTSDVAYVMAHSTLERTFLAFSSTNIYSVASIFGRAFTTDFTANNTMITLKFKQEPTITPETFSETQANALDAKHCNYFVTYNNNAAIIQQGVMCNGFFFDEVYGTDWLANAIQTNVFNLLYTSPTKIPQTDAGVNQIVNVVEQACGQGVNNGLLAPGVWNGPPIGGISTGQTLPKGYFVYAPLVASQSQALRETRVAPTLQVLVKLAGAVHKANVLVSVNR